MIYPLCAAWQCTLSRELLVFLCRSVVYTPSRNVNTFVPLSSVHSLGEMVVPSCRLVAYTSSGNVGTFVPLSGVHSLGNY